MHLSFNKGHFIIQNINMGLDLDWDIILATLPARNVPEEEEKRKLVKNFHKYFSSKSNQGFFQFLNKSRTNHLISHLTTGSKVYFYKNNPKG